MSDGVKNILKFEPEADRRLPAHYTSYHIGRLLLITGSVTLLTGLLLKFFFYETRIGPIFVCTVIICVLGVGQFMFGAFLVIYAVYKSSHAQQAFIKENDPTKPHVISTSQRSAIPLTRSVSQSLDNNMNNVTSLGPSSLEHVDQHPMRH